MSPSLQAWHDGGQFVRSNSHRVFVRRAGEGPVLLLVHGFPLGSYDWHLVWDALARHFTVVTLDLLGHGFSDKPRGFRYGLAAHADLVESLLQRLDLPRLHVVLTLVMQNEDGVAVVFVNLMRSRTKSRQADRDEQDAA